MTEIERLRKENEQLRTIYQTAAQSSLRFQDKVQFTLQQCLDELGAKCAIIIRDKPTQSVPIISCNCVSFEDENKQLAFEIVHEVCQMGKGHKEAFNISTGDLDLLLKLDPTHKGCVVQPLWCDDIFIGVIAFFYRKIDTVELNSTNGNFLGLIGGWISRAISNQEKASLNILNQESVKNAEQAICWVDIEFQIKYQNEAFKSIFGRDKEGLRITDISENFSEESWQHHIDHCIKNGRTTTQDRVISSDSGYRDVEITLENISNKNEVVICCYIKDITARKELQQKAELRETYFSNVLDKSPVGIVITTSKNNIEFSNQAFQKMIGYTGKELSELTVKAICLRWEDGELIKEFLEGPERSISIEKQYQRKDGSNFWAATSVGKILTERNKLTYVAFIQDITKTKANEQELKEANEELERFFYISTHDLKVPIANIQGFAQYLIEDSLTNKDHIKEQLHWIRSSADSGSKLLESLNKIATARRNNQPNSDKEVFLLEEILDEIIIDLSSDIEKSKAEFFINIQKSEISAHRVNIFSVLQNLISNAIKYRSEERQVLIKILTQQQGKNLLIQIEDNGRGIDLDKNGDKVFNLFSRFHSGVKGSGLGLYLSKTLIKKENGEIEINSTPQVGTTFTITFFDQYLA